MFIIHFATGGIVWWWGQKVPNQFAYDWIVILQVISHTLLCISPHEFLLFDLIVIISDSGIVYIFIRIIDLYVRDEVIIQII